MGVLGENFDLKKKVKKTCTDKVRCEGGGYVLCCEHFAIFVLWLTWFFALIVATDEEDGLDL